MAETITCPGCGQRYPFRTNLAGRKVKCKKCQRVFTVTASLVIASSKASRPDPAPKVASPPRAAPSLASSPSNDSDMASLFDEEFGEVVAAEVVAEGGGFSAAPAAGTSLPRPKQDRPSAPRVSGNPLVTKKLFLAVCALAAAVFVFGLFTGHAVMGLVFLGVGGVIAPFGLLPYPAQSPSPAGRLFALVGIGLALIGATAVVVAALPTASMMNRPLSVRIGFLVGLFLGVMILPSILVTILAVFMRYFGFFRPAAWTFLFFALVHSASMLLAPPSDASSPASPPIAEQTFPLRPSSPPAPGMATKATLKIRDVAGLDVTRELMARFERMGGFCNIQIHATGGVATVTLDPIDDVAAFAAKIDFGKVLQVDPQRRVIEIAADRAQFRPHDPFRIDDHQIPINPLDPWDAAP